MKFETVKFSTGYYYLCDVGYRNAEGFLADLYRRERYHISEWRGRGNTPTIAPQFFNMKHYPTRNVIERAFKLLNGQ